MIEKIKALKDYIIGIVIISICCYCGYLYIGKKILVAHNEILIKSQEVLNKQIDTYNGIIAENIKQKERDNEIIVAANLNLSKAIKSLENATKQVVINKPKTDEDVVLKISYLYKDPTTQVTNTDFLIKKNTTYGLVYDAEQWKVNGPILEENLDKSLKLNTEYKFGLEIRDNALINRDTLISNMNEKDKVKDKLLDNKDGQLGNVTKQLHLEQKSGKIKFIGGVVSGLVLYYIQDKLRKK